VLTSLCNRAIWLDSGEIHRMGSAGPVVREYEYEIHKLLSAGKGEIVPLEEEVNPLEVQEIDATGRESTGDDTESPVPTSTPEWSEVNKIFKKGPVFIDRVEFLDAAGIDTRIIRRWEKMTIRVCYHCEGEIPEESLGMAVGIHRKSDLLRVSHFSTMWVARDQDLVAYSIADFRKRPGQEGVIECVIDPIQLAEGEYYFSVGLAPNNPVVADFYEQRYEAYTITILRDGHELNGLVYYPIIRWEHETKNPG
jgi:hypothetical protein